MTDQAPTPDTGAPVPGPGKSLLAKWVSGRSVLALLVASLALVLAAIPMVMPREIGPQVRDYLLANPEVLDEVVAARQQREDGNRVQTTNAAVAANPDLLKADSRDPAFGPETAKVTVIQFFDFRCPGCKVVAPDFVRMIERNPDVRFIFKDWPILDRGDDVASQYAARAAVAAHLQGKYIAVYEGLMAEPSLEEASVDRVLVERGVDLARAKNDMASPDVARQLADIHTTAAVFQLTGTPSFIINGMATAGIAPQEVQEAIDLARSR